jgi:rRNA-processing protein FCF1
MIDYKRLFLKVLVDKDLLIIPYQSQCRIHDTQSRGRKLKHIKVVV